MAVALDAALRAAALHDAEGRLLRTLGDLVASLTPIDVSTSATGAPARPAIGGVPVPFGPHKPNGPAPADVPSGPASVGDTGTSGPAGTAALDGTAELDGAAEIDGAAGLGGEAGAGTAQVLPAGLTLADAVGRLLSGPHSAGDQVAVAGPDGRAVHYSAWDLFASLAAALAHSTMNDPLTGLPTRQWVLDEVTRRLAGVTAEAPFGLLQIELGQLKDINDSLGYEVGDALIVEAASRIRAALGPADHVGRLVGDEFAVVIGPLPVDSAAADAVALAQRLLDVLAHGVRLGGHELLLQASVGVCVVDEPGDGAEAVLRRADSAMHRAKGRGRGRAELYDPAADRPVDKLSMTRRLREAITNGGMYLHWQPIHRLRDGALVGAEALIRWQDETGRLISPDEFIPYAETVGLIIPIGTLVLDVAAKQASRWQLRGVPLPVSVNLSAQQIVGSDLVGEVAGVLERYGVPPSALRLELTETAAVTDYGVTARRLAELRALGVRLSLDDFGTGYSSLRLLRDLAVDDVKVDRSFVAGIDSSDADAAMVRLVVETSHALGLTVTAEGVERLSQLEKLAALGCDHVQGFLLGRPVPVADFEIAGSLAAARALSAPAVVAHAVGA
ncbi:MAG TPA: bifunctional diguanylate cyclase/phosphodiesterase [Mycobacteriales bacterium]|nr:bifunctional diguanylate cyclase/phosphodiesterase [Mycobacteriales bacterium]